MMIPPKRVYTNLTYLHVYSFGGRSSVLFERKTGEYHSDRQRVGLCGKREILKFEAGEQKERGRLLLQDSDRIAGLEV